MHIGRYLKPLYAERGKLRRARFIIVSTEDKDTSSAGNWRVPARNRAAQIRRDALNLTASRLQNLSRRPGQGWRASLQSIKTSFFDARMAFIQKEVLDPPEVFGADELAAIATPFRGNLAPRRADPRFIP